MAWFIEASGSVWMSKISVAGWVVAGFLAAIIWTDFVRYAFVAQNVDADEHACRSRELQVAVGQPTAKSAEEREKSAREYCIQRRATIAAEHQAQFAKSALSVGLATLIAAILAGVGALLAAKFARDTVDTMQDTARRQLRAYVGHMPNGAHFEGRIVRKRGEWVVLQRGRVKYFDENHGQTPARDVAMYVRIIPDIDKPPRTIDWDDLGSRTDDRKEFLSFIPPHQNIGRIVGTQTAKDTFFLYGYVNYTDIFDHCWQHRFGFSHNPARKRAGDEAWVAHGECNEEKDLGPAKKA